MKWLAWHSSILPWRLAALVLVLMLALPWVAFADNLVPDGDNTVPVNPNDLNFGTVCANTVVSRDILLAISRNGNYPSTNVFGKGTSVTVTHGSTPPGLTVTGGGTIQLPNDWDVMAMNTMSGTVSSTVTLSVATAGSFSGSVPYTATGTSSKDSNPLTRDATLNVTASIVNCTPSDTTPPVITPNVAGTLGSNGWYTSDVTVSWTVSDPESTISSTTGCDPTTINSDTTGTTLTCTATSAGGTSTKSVTIKRDATPPTATLSITSGTAGANGWYTSDVTVQTTGSDSISSPVTCTADQTLSSETTGTVVNGSCTNDAGLKTDAAPLTIKIDKTAPTGVALSVIGGTLGANGWYTSDVTVHTSGADSISGVTCTADQYQTTETTGTVFNGSCTNGAGLTTNAAPLTVKLDKTGPSATLAVTAGTLGANGWYISDVTVSTTGTDSISSPVTCTADQHQTTDTTGTGFNGSCTNNAGLTTNAAPLTIKRDATPPTIAITAPATNGTYVLNAAVASNYSCGDVTSGLASCSGPVANGASFDTSAVGSKTFTVNAADAAGNTATATNIYKVQYATGGQCLGSPGHAILQPINADGTSVFKQGSTVPAKFRVCDANGASIGTAGVASNFKLVKALAGTVESTVNEDVVSTTPDTAFRWDPSAQQWIYNISTKSLNAKATYFYLITLNDGSTIDFSFGLK